MDFSALSAHKYAKRLSEAGAPPEQVDAHADFAGEVVKIISARDTVMETKWAENSLEHARLEARIESRISEAKQDIMRWVLVVVGAGVAILATLITTTTILLKLTA
ncbi:hypothetical protein ACHMW6_28810 [Pseudoduganella sp. UC29_106]|uniref:hypothetical protein n=1 Tax=Pseudoduganella sp. UC29_106 TaxID=3374553 RepID=UPI0037578FC5